MAILSPLCFLVTTSSPPHFACKTPALVTRSLFPGRNSCSSRCPPPTQTDCVSTCRRISRKRRGSYRVCCSATKKPSSSSEIRFRYTRQMFTRTISKAFESQHKKCSSKNNIQKLLRRIICLCDRSSTAKIRSEVLAPFRSVRMFFYLAFIASGAIGGLIATTRLIPALTNSSRVVDLPEMLKGLGIDIGAVLFFAFLYTRENSARNTQLEKLSREENLSKLKLRVDEKKTISVGDLRGVARLVILAGPASYITDSFSRSISFTDKLMERGVLVVPFATDGTAPFFQFDENNEDPETITKRKRLWQLTPLYTFEWTNWLDEQKKLANVSLDSPVYLSLRMDGRVRGSGVGYPPWNAFVAQLPPVKGFWSGFFDGMDGRVL